ncbi:MAG: UDP-N-acetylmuramoyl-L-alanyl-D-glutamate--2,6-diaminopimelate ligase [Nannocystaceae bacterium]
MPVTAPTLGELLAPFAPRYHRCGPADRVAALAVDSRAVSPGAIFIALRGETHDAHAFVDQAIAQGAGALVVEAGRLPALAHPHVAIADTSAALPRIAAAFYGWPGDQLRLAGITGTNGKTTTSYLVAATLAAAGRPHARLGTVGNWIVDHEAASGFTTPFPLELQALLADIRDRGGSDVVMEVSSHALAQGRARPLRFRAVGMTSFSQDHLDFHGTMDAYLAAKRRLSREHLAADGVAVAAIDDHPACLEFLADAPAGARRWRASRRADSGAELRALRPLGEPGFGVAVEIATPAGRGPLRSPLVGDFNLDNLLVAVGLGLGLGLDLAVLLDALATSPGAPGRLERIRVADRDPGRDPEIYVDYAHTPEAVAHALRTLRPRCRGELIVLLGCGGDRDRGKRPLMGRHAAAVADRFYATSDNPRTEDPAAIVADMVAGVDGSDRAKVIVEVDRRRAIARAVAEAAADDVVVIAGKGHEDYQIVGRDKLPFSDADEARAGLRARG